MNKFDKSFMHVAHVISELSYAQRNKVGSVIVKDGNILAFGYNGTPSGWDNTCEDIIELQVGDDIVLKNITKPEVLHSEMNAISKIAKSTNSSEGSTMYCTLSPCYDCSKAMYQAGVARVVYDEIYRDTSGIEFLEKCGVKIERIEHDKKT